MKTFFRLTILLFFVQSHAQVGINTTSPDAQLDIKASNQAAPSNTDGMLIPRVDAFPATNPTAAQQGMMVYLMVTSGANLPGLYYWDNFSTSWVGISSTANGDKDWYKVGTTTAPSAITDDMFHDGKVGIGISTPSSKLHIMNTASGMTTSPSSLVTLENNAATYFSLLSGASESGILFGANSNSVNGAIIYNPGGLPNGMLFRTNGNLNRMVIGDTGNVAIGNLVPNYPLHFPATLGDKISLYGGTGPHYGFGIQGNLMQIHSDFAVSDIAFGYGSSAAFTERMRVRGNGNVGIGISNPLTKLQVRKNSSGMLPNTESVATIENDTNAFLNILSTTESGVVFGADGNSTNGGVIYNTWPNSLAFRTNGNINRMTISDTGKIGLGNFIADYPLHFPSVFGDKVSFWGTGANHYGFGLQSNLLQIHSDFNYSDIAFGYGSSGAFSENVRIKGNGNVGIGTSAPDYPLQFKTVLGDKISLYGGTGNHVGFGVQGNLLQIHSDFVTTDVAFGYGSSTAFNETMRVKGNGNVGIGTTTPVYPLQFKSDLGDKISLWGGAGAHYGLGIQAYTMQLHTAGITDDIVFGYGTSAAFTEKMRIKGSGEVGIGTPTPTAELEVNGFTKMGTTAPAVKMLKFTGTTNAAQGSSTSIAHGLTSSKILAVNILVEYSAGNSVPPSYTASVGYEFDYFISATNITVVNKFSNSSLILSKPMRVLVTYEE